MSSVHDFFMNVHVDIEELSKYLDRLDKQSRISEIRDLTAPEQSVLFEAAKGFRPITLNYFVPESTPPKQQVIHYGRNSLPLFRNFEKRFCRSGDPSTTDELWGYNEQIFKEITGPGYFVARQSDEEEVVIDYFFVPPYKPPSWPEILPNSARLSRFIYYHTRDYMRGVSKHVSIGRASRDGKPMNNWFVLCREGPLGRNAGSRWT